MNKANSDNSVRLKNTLWCLRSHLHGATTWDIQRWTGSMAPSTDISELRANGYIIDRTYEGKTSTGRKINRYRLMGRRSPTA